MSDGFLNEHQVAEYLGVTTSAVRLWRYNNTGPAFYKLGGRVKYKREDLDAWIESNRIEPANK